MLYIRSVATAYTFTLQNGIIIMIHIERKMIINENNLVEKKTMVNNNDMFGNCYVLYNINITGIVICEKVFEVNASLN